MTDRARGEGGSSIALHLGETFKLLIDHKYNTHPDTEAYYTDSSGAKYEKRRYIFVGADQDTEQAWADQQAYNKLPGQKIKGPHGKWAGWTFPNPPDDVVWPESSLDPTRSQPDPRPTPTSPPTQQFNWTGGGWPTNTELPSSNVPQMGIGSQGNVQFSPMTADETTIERAKNEGHPIPPITESPEIAHDLETLEHETEESEFNMQLIKQAIAETHDSEDIETRAKDGEGADQTSLTVHGRYVGPGNPLPAGKPSSKLDEIALRHDIRYHVELKHKHWPYLTYQYADKIMIDEINQNMEQIKQEGNEWLANFIKSLWTTQKLYSAPIGVLLENIIPEMGWYSGDTANKIYNFNQFQHALTRHGKTTWTGLNDPIHLPFRPDRTHPSETDSPSNADADQAAKKKPPKSAPPSSHSPTNKNLSSTDMSTCDANTAPTVDTICTNDGLPIGISNNSTSTASPGGTESQGGGGGAAKCPEKWFGGVTWEGNTFTTYNTRRCMLTPFNTKYLARSGVDNTPSVDIETPWYYFDLNAFSCHINPHTMQEIVEHTDGIRPLSLTITIAEIQAKDVSMGSGSTSSTYTITESQTATMLLHRDSDYDLPYPIGGGQDTIPDHLPGDWYSLPRYCYKTLGGISAEPKEHRITNTSTFCNGTRITNQTWTERHHSVQDSELFLIEGMPCTQLHPNCSWSYQYSFPHVSWALTTQYCWNTRRQDNPCQQLRFYNIKNTHYEDTKQDIDVVMCTSSSDTTCSNECGTSGSNNKIKRKRITVETKGNVDHHNRIQLQNNNVKILRASNTRPAMWLPAPRHPTGDCVFINPANALGIADNKIDSHYAFSNQKKHIILIEEELYSNGTTHSKTCLPGPVTQESAIRTPEGAILINTNALAVARNNADQTTHPAIYTNGECLPPNKTFQLVINTRRGADGPSNSTHIKNSTTDTTNFGIEQCYGMMPGQVAEKQSGFYENQIWCRNPNTDMADGGGNPLIAQWGIKSPPHLILVRMLPTPANSTTDMGKYKSPIMGSILNQYMTFQIQYAMKWEYLPKSRNKCWNPITPPQLPQPSNGHNVIYNLDTRRQGNQYCIPDETWAFKQRIRNRR
ncbi:structural protein [Roe deer copiparvovirus]|uniref:Structural protein n=1 Tax=Roe deer copiparvovirus TaxID=2555547 RepID=A0A482EUQ0_9VIRU|nr:structural protein [Roe deer copiparvovirus]QBM79592.1 structural protein [Roe deer copiparvovirus]